MNKFLSKNGTTWGINYLRGWLAIFVLFFSMALSSDLSAQLFSNHEHHEHYGENDHLEECGASYMLSSSSASISASGVSGFCLFCNVSGESKILDSNLGDYANIKMPIGVGGHGYIRLALPRTYPAGTRVGWVADVNGGIAGLFNGVTLIARNNGAVVGQESGGSLFNILGFGGGKNINAIFCQEFDEIEIRMGSLVGLLANYRVYSAFISEDCTFPTHCGIAPPQPELCNDGIDNNGNGLIDENCNDGGVCTFLGFDEYKVEDGSPEENNQAFAAYQGGSAGGLHPDNVPVIGFDEEHVYVLAPDGSIDEYSMYAGHVKDNNPAFAAFSGGTASGVSPRNAKFVGAFDGLVYVQGADGTIDGYDDSDGRLKDDNNFSFNNTIFTDCIVGIGRSSHVYVAKQDGSVDEYSIETGALLDNNAPITIVLQDGSTVTPDCFNILGEEGDEIVIGCGRVIINPPNPLLDTDGDGIANVNDLDDDNDGIRDVTENATAENGGDTDGDGIPDSLDLDSDNDGINDVIEAGGIDANRDGIADGAIGNAVNTIGIPSSAGQGLTPPDTDNDDEPDYQDLDSDNDTISDLIEGGSNAPDADNNGVADGPDADKDGIVDAADGNDGAFGDLNDPMPVDTDNEGTPDYLDPDSDDPNDNIVDNADGINDDIDDAGNAPLDADNDGLIDNDNDVDDDGIADVIDNDVPKFGGLVKPNAPVGQDTDGDGIPDAQDLDDDNDGITDVVENATAENGNDTDGDGIPDSLDLDSDNDGINDVIEANGTDANDDGIADGVVGNAPTTLGIPATAGTGLTPPDTDNDDAPDFQDLDSDNDTVSDLVEGGSNAPDVDDNGVADGPDADQDGIVDAADGNDAKFGDLNDPMAPDTDNEGTPDYRDPDSDDPNDNIVDNADGINDDIDEAGNAPLDADNDGLIDNDNDVDDDGIADVIDNDIPKFGGLGKPAGQDTDGDGVPDVEDLDDDNDGILDVVEIGDADGDGIPNALDLDSDNDGCSDANEFYESIAADGGDDEEFGVSPITVNTDGTVIGAAYVGNYGNVTDATISVCKDTDGDGVPDVEDLDDDNDGIRDVVEMATASNGGDTDGDGIPDSLDLDSDNDGINDVIEADGIDPNGDGIAEGPVGMLANTNGIPASAGTGLTPPNTDNDSQPDFQDLDADNDTVSDLIEGGSNAPDVDDNGVADGPDADQDGIVDAADGNDGAFGDQNDPAPTDTDNEGTPDFQDPDSDDPTDNIVDNTDGANDDIDEAGNTPLDADQDGLVDNPTDTDQDGIADVVDDMIPLFGGLGTPDGKDTDDDGITDAEDLDDDNDGITDVVEMATASNGGDTDGDGIPDSLDLDSDNDGINDVVEAGGIDPNGDGIAEGPVGMLVNTNGIPASAGTGLTPPNTDNDGQPDFQDLDSDNDTVSDLIEGGSNAPDVDDNGVADGPDLDQDGIVDAADGNDAVFGDQNDPAPTDTDNEGTPDFQDPDSDDPTDNVVDNTDGANDDIDNAGNAPLDADQDGLLDNPTDTDQDGIADVVDEDIPLFGGLGAPAGQDTDDDGIPDTADLDDDNDGITDVVEMATASNGGDTDGDGIPDSLDLDSDNDGINDVVEAGGIDPNGDGLAEGPVGMLVNTNGIPASAGTGLTPPNTDNDGQPDFQDLDSDNDTVSDLVEGGSNAPDVDDNGVADGPDADQDGIVDAADGNDGAFGDQNDPAPTDTDNEGTPDFQDPDSDDPTDNIVDNTDGANDDIDDAGNAPLDANNDGLVDNPTDTDQDGIADVVDEDIPLFGGLGAPAGQDTDGDGVPDAIDLDDDNDGILDIREDGDTDIDGPNNGDADGDGIPNRLELDSDNDGCSDANEFYESITADGGDDQEFGTSPISVNADGTVIGASYPTNFGDADYTTVMNATTITICIDTDGDGIPDLRDLDDDNDGITDVVEMATASNGGDTDGDGIPDSLDLDSDNDGINDVVEAGGIDPNGDGLAEGPVGMLVNTNGIPASAGTGLTPPNTDNDGQPDFQDLDSDNDTVSDLVEGGSNAPDVDDNGVADGPDADQDGIVDAADGNDGAFGDLNDPTAPDTDNEGTPDFQDPDSDDPTDNIVDNTDGANDDIDDAGNAPLDANNDGLVDNPTDTDQDGIADVVDEDIPLFGGLGTPDGKDTDGDGIPDAMDLDDDNDGIRDVVEMATASNGGDTDGDGIPDSLDLDSDNDGINDVVEADGIDNNNDGIADGAVGMNPNTMGIPASAGTGLTPPNTDNDGQPDFQDLDADNDTVSDLVEGGSNAPDANDDGVADGPDADQDGIVDAADGNDGVFGDQNDPAPTDTDNEGTPDFQDPDSDDPTDNVVDNTDGANDDIDDAGNTPLDANNDGLIDNPTDTDQDGIADVVDENIPQFGGLGTPNPVITTPNITVSDATVNENAGSATLQVMLSEPTTLPVTVTYATANGSAVNGQDYTFTSGTVTIPAGATTASIIVPINNDQADESNETFTVNLSNPQNGNLTDPQATVTIIDNDDPVVIAPSITVNDMTVDEDAGTAVVLLTLTSPTTLPVTVNYVTSDGSALIGQDYGFASGTVTFPAGSTMATITVPILDDSAEEATENFLINLSNPTNVMLSDPQLVVTILDNDDNNPGPGGDCNSVVVTGANGQINITNIPADAKIEYGGAGTGWSFVMVCQGNCATTQTVNNLAAGQYTVKVQTFNPYCYAETTVTVTGGVDPCSTQGGDSDGDGICDNQDNCPFVANPDQADDDNDGIGNVCEPVVVTPNITVSDATVNENAGTATVQVMLSQPTSLPVTVNYVTSNGSAVNGQDYSFASGTVTIPAGATTASIIVSINDDQADESNETFTVNLNNPQNGIITDPQGTVTIIDNDNPVITTPNITVSDATVNEDAGTATVQVMLSQPTMLPVTVNYVTSNGSAVNGQDYSFVSGTVIIPAGATTASIFIPISEDQADEANETFTVNLSSPQNGVITDPQATVTIIDNDDNNPGPSGDCNSVVVSGGNGQINITNIPADAKVEYGGAGTGWSFVVVCEGNCATSQTVNSLAEGHYTVKVQTFNPYCYAETTVTVTGGVDPCAAQGGDRDGDGVCDDVDNCINTANADQADNDNDGIGNVCDDTPDGPVTGGDCSSVTVLGGQGAISISEIPAGAKIEYSGPSTNYQVNLVCDQDCNNAQSLTNLIAGNYNIVIQTFDPYCYKLYNVDVTAVGSACDGQGGDSDGDGICDNQDNCPAIANADQADNDNDGIGNVCDDTPNGPEVTDCDQVVATMTNGQLTVSGLNAPITILKVFDANWESVYECNGNKCPETVTFRADPNEVTCHVDVQFYNADWTLICSKQITLTAGSASSRNAEQLNFTAYREGRKVELEWFTNSGWRNQHFELERSTDGVNFDYLQTIDNTDNTDDLAYYTELDLTPQLGDNYYRIKEVRLDGTISYTNIDKVNFSIDLENLSMFPNPAGNNVFFNLKGLEGAPVTIKLVNMYGQELKTLSIDKVEDTNVHLPINTIPNGLYNVIIGRDGQRVISRKLIVEKLY